MKIWCDISSRMAANTITNTNTSTNTNTDTDRVVQQMETWCDLSSVVAAPSHNHTWPAPRHLSSKFENTFCFIIVFVFVFVFVFVYVFGKVAYRDLIFDVLHPVTCPPSLKTLFFYYHFLFLCICLPKPCVSSEKA